jgi:hypothetical protein
MTQNRSGPPTGIGGTANRADDNIRRSAALPPEQPPSQTPQRSRREDNGLRPARKPKTKPDVPGAAALRAIGDTGPKAEPRARKGSHAAQSIYSGRDRLGHVEQSILGEWRAFDRRGKPLGVFENRSEAIAAIGRSLQGQR